MDIAGLSKLTGDSIQLLVMCLGFMVRSEASDLYSACGGSDKTLACFAVIQAFGYATE